MTKSTNLFTRLNDLLRHTEASWDQCIASLWDQGDTERAEECAADALYAEERWDKAIERAQGGREAKLGALDAMVEARELADKWGDCSAEREAEELIKCSIDITVLTVTSDGMGGNAEESDYDNFIAYLRNYVPDHIDVEALDWCEPGDTTAEGPAREEALELAQDAWEAWCAGESE